ncbi:MAG TPA: hypothetical protein ENI87_01730, partial [bacterium]|nr:hypothetical protein [bacterium]
AGRAELVRRTIAPAVQRGAVVVAERCFLSTAVYQLAAGEPQPGVLDIAWFEDLTRRVHGDCLPDAVVILDVPAEVSARRRSGRADDRIEARGEDYHRRVRRGYLQMAEREPRARVVDAAQPFPDVQRQLRELVGRML